MSEEKELRNEEKVVKAVNRMMDRDITMEVSSIPVEGEYDLVVISVLNKEAKSGKETKTSCAFTSEEFTTLIAFMSVLDKNSNALANSEIKVTWEENKKVCSEVNASDFENELVEEEKIDKAEEKSKTAQSDIDENFVMSLMDEVLESSEEELNSITDDEEDLSNEDSSEKKKDKKKKKKEKKEKKDKKKKKKNKSKDDEDGKVSPSSDDDLAASATEVSELEAFEKELLGEFHEEEFMPEPTLEELEKIKETKGNDAAREYLAKLTQTQREGLQMEIIRRKKEQKKKQ